MKINKLRYYRETIKSICDIIDVRLDSYSDPLTVLLSANTIINNCYDELYTDYNHADVTTDHVNAISIILDGIKADIYENIIKYVLDKYNKE